MLSSSTTVRSGLYAEPITGLGLQGTGLQALREGRDHAAALGLAIRDALARAREQGLSAFEPDSDTLQLPPSVPLAEVRGLFAAVIGHPYQPGDELIVPGLPAYGPMSLAQWSGAESDLAVYVAQEDSKLPATAGGGSAYSRGRWFVNGQPYTLSELFLTVRMGSLGELDRELATNLDTLNANTTLAKQLLHLLADMERRRELRQAQAADAAAPAPAFLAGEDYSDFVGAAGLTVPRLMELGEQFKGSGSALKRVGEQALASRANLLSADDYDGARDELRAMFDSINSENDVKKLRVDTLQNARLAVLGGMSAFLNSDLQQKRTAERNL